MDNNLENPKSTRDKILVVDDADDMREYCHLLLRQNGYDFYEAANGQKALEITLLEKPDLIVVDVMMPVVDGLEFLKILRATEEICEIPVVLLSAWTGENARIEGMEAGADDYLEKPFSANELLACIGAHLKLSRMRRKVAEYAAMVQREKEITQRIVEAQEVERKRFARDLHDELGQQFTVLQIKLERAKNLCQEQEVCDQITEIQEIAKKIDEGVDFLAWQLRPALLDDFGLFAALEKYVFEWSQHSGIAAELLSTKLKQRRLIPEIEINLYRIVQEALNNVHKHSEAQKVEISLNLREETVILIIEDDGQGFNTEEKVNLSRGIGLTGMRERVELLGGSLDIESVIDQGSTVFARVPAKFVEEEILYAG